VENSLNTETDPEYQPRTSLIEENKKLFEALKERNKTIHHLELLVEKLEEDLQIYRRRVFTDTASEKIRDYNRRLVQILREPGTHTSEAILSRLGVDPSNVEAIKMVSAQLDTLQAFGLVRHTSRGWVGVE